ncbi:MAG: hypothetical protein LC662_05510 [Rhodothermaceae bacterium]|nr:hypothetical protein [Rhodothermaceae bacterium]
MYRPIRSVNTISTNHSKFTFPTPAAMVSGSPITGAHDNSKLGRPYFSVHSRALRPLRDAASRGPALSRMKYPIP